MLKTSSARVAQIHAMSVTVWIKKERERNVKNEKAQLTNDPTL
jgi:hypothetical protein